VKGGEGVALCECERRDGDGERGGFASGKVEPGVKHGFSLCEIAATVNRAALLYAREEEFPLSLNFFLEGLLLDDFERGGDSGLVQGTQTEIEGAADHRALVTHRQRFQ